MSSENEEYMPFCAFYFQYGYSASAIDHDFNVAQSTPIMSTWSDLHYCELCAATDHDAYLIPPCLTSGSLHLTFYKYMQPAES